MKGGRPKTEERVSVVSKLLLVEMCLPTCSNNVTAYRSCSSLRKRYAVVSPASPVPITATFSCMMRSFLFGETFWRCSIEQLGVRRYLPQPMISWSP